MLCAVTGYQRLHYKEVLWPIGGEMLGKGGMLSKAASILQGTCKLPVKGSGRKNFLALYHESRENKTSCTHLFDQACWNESSGTYSLVLS